jgi:hypothetical protein
MLLSYGLVNFFILSDILLNAHMLYITHVSFSIAFIFFLLSWLRNPGFVEQDPTIDFFECVEKFDCNNLCPECEVIRTSRSRHCNICNRCVERFDHHCPWINNCVGTKNHGFFYIYVLSTLIYIVMVLLLSMKVLIRGFEIEDPFAWVDV